MLAEALCQFGEIEVDRKRLTSLQPIMVNAGGDIRLGGRIEAVGEDDGLVPVTLHRPEVLDAGAGVRVRFGIPVAVDGIGRNHLDDQNGDIRQVMGYVRPKRRDRQPSLAPA